jgi:hypothetical protein
LDNERSPDIGQAEVGVVPEGDRRFYELAETKRLVIRNAG